LRVCMSFSRNPPVFLAMLILVADRVEWRGMRYLTHEIFPFFI
jgi:hypothetical protein